MRLSEPMLENCLTMLGHSPRGHAIAVMLEGVILPGEYGFVAERSIAYWQKFKKPPGVHLIDEFADVLERPNDPRIPAIKFILDQMWRIKDGINEDYVLSRMSNYVRFTAISNAVLDVADRLARFDDTSVEDAEEMMQQALRARRVEFDPGLTLHDAPAFIDYLDAKRGIVMGIEPLDKARVQPQRKTLFCKVGVAGHGKTWFLVHVGAQALRQRLKVVHISLEIEAAAVLGRYYQSLFSASEHQVRHKITELITNASGHVTDRRITEIDPEFAFRDDTGLLNVELHREITSRVGHHAGVGKNLRVRAWPPRVCSIAAIESYLDTLSETQHFEPDVVVIDYPQLLKASPSNFRLELGQNVEHLRRIAIERNCAVVMVHQSSRAGAKAKAVTMTHVAEDWSVVQTADFLLSYSATTSEQRLGLARLHIDKARVPGAKGKTLILSQNYDIGQYCLSASLMPDNYLDYMEAAAPAPVAEAEDEPEGEGNVGLFG